MSQPPRAVTPTLPALPPARAPSPWTDAVIADAALLSHGVFSPGGYGWYQAVTPEEYAAGHRLIAAGLAHQQGDRVDWFAIGWRTRA